ncbi:MAG: type II toxin-antitoxin system prevent-host-death family antitoxin [Lachnospiraceae bacterium]|jgi:prevent-host-death family protein|nr:type II toxin-antitoxin system prevent-host-death family antitoxin [Lachnospiraceae bacterium]
MYNTIARPARELRNNYADIIRTLKEHNQILITNNGKGEAVLINAEDFADYEEYLHIRYVRDKLEEAEARAADPVVKWLTHEEFFAKARAKL